MYTTCIEICTGIDSILLGIQAFLAQYLYHWYYISFDWCDKKEFICTLEDLNRVE